MANNVVSDHLEPWRSLAGKVVMVTGASSGIGWDICLDLASAGCKVIAAARRKDRLRSICDKMNGDQSSEEPRAVGIELDVSADGPSIKSAVKQAWEAFGTIDAVINNAGVRGTVKSSLDLSEDEWDSTMRTNLTGTWLVSKYICSHMRDAKKQGGSIINISSIAGLNRGQLPGSVAYTSSKAAVNTLTKVMALELGEFNIRVNSINPGLFKSEITQGLMEKEWINNIALKTIPLKSTGTVQPDLTSLIKYLIHDSSAFVSGNVFIADAGATLPGVPLFSSL
ncbi:3-oxoacyl-[acyl-carrier-protein] reductase FabG-like [Impatiens glandulifera]|uniref:3-oxoacyl-[acyl-carrier-protein] reductase FabG-like n=1 Tax=Impatiens glandulifera TaxID=253017 RepID=UPI001FB1154A|nr:3-oxoacyl-[acyl-carrier-protein] reductase FabG-like [Impatiens glandulifera]